MNLLLKFILGTLSISIYAKVNSIKDIDAVSIQSHVSIGTKAPEGWTLDNVTAAQFGVCAFYYLKGKDFHSAPAIIYPRIVTGKEGEKGINALVSEAVENYKSAKNFQLKHEKPFKNKNGLSFTVKHFMHGPPPNQYEAVGYLSFNKAIVLLVYSAQTESDFKKHLSKFNEALNNISPYSSNLSPLSGNCLYPK